MRAVLLAMQQSPTTWPRLVTDPLRYLWAETIRLLPTLIGAILVFLVLWIVALVARAVVRKVARMAQMDALLEGTRLAGVLHALDERLTLSRLLGAIAYYAVLVSGLAAAAELLGLHAVREVVVAVAAFLPRLIGALLALALGAALASAVARAVESVARQATSPYAGFLGRTAEVLLLLVVLTVALDLLGADLEILHANLTILLGAGSLTLAFLAGWAMRQPAEHIVANFYVRRILSVGDRVRFDSHEGTVERFTPLGFVLQGKDGERHLVLAKEYLQAHPKWAPGS